MDDFKILFDPDMAVLPIMTATWEKDPMDAIVQYQNKVLKGKIGLWEGRKTIDLFNALSSGAGKRIMKDLIEKNEISIPGSINDLEVKLHSRMCSRHIQLTISDNTEINRLRDEKKRDQIVRGFMDVSSHELRTPLSIILGYISMLSEYRSDQKKFEQIIHLIESNAQKLNHIVNDMFKLVYEMDFASPNHKTTQCNIGERIKDAFPMFSGYLPDYEFSQKGLQLTDTKTARIARDTFDTILSEIMINLRRNTPPGGNIMIHTFDDNSGVHVRVDNECEGIPPHFLEKIFDPFFRYQDPLAHSTGYEYGQGGAGMGLAIIKKYVTQTGGKVWFENKLPYKSGKKNVVLMHMIFPLNE